MRDINRSWKVGERWLKKKKDIKEGRGLVKEVCKHIVYKISLDTENGGLT